MLVGYRKQSGRGGRLYRCYVMSQAEEARRDRQAAAGPAGLEGARAMRDHFRKRHPGADDRDEQNGFEAPVPEVAGEAADVAAMDAGAVAALRSERDSYLDLARRERADFDNYRKRVEREMKQLKRESLASFLKDFFGPLDDLDRVLQESSKTHSFDSLATGVRIMEENFWRTLAKAGVKKIDAKGKPFDPNLHEAMAVVPSSEYAPGTVIEVFDNGYKLDDFILRPARVVVSRAPDA